MSGFELDTLMKSLSGTVGHEIALSSTSRFGSDLAAGFRRIVGELPAVVDVTPRRVQHFRCRPGERVRWRFGTQSGIARADDRGAVTIEDLKVGTDWDRLVLTRD